MQPRRIKHQYVAPILLIFTRGECHLLSAELAVIVVVVPTAADGAAGLEQFSAELTSAGEVRALTWVISISTDIIKRARECSTIK